VILPLIISKRSGNTGDEIRSQSGELAAYVLENIRGLDESIQYQSGKSRMEGMNCKTQQLTENQGKLNKLTGFNLALANTFILVFDTAMLLLSAYLYSKGTTDFSGFIIPLIALMSSYGPVSALANLGTTLQSTIASGGRVLDIIEETPETEEITGKHDIAFGGADCENVTFSYGGGTVLRDFSMKFPENKIVGVIGKSGSGKSTLLKLLMRFWKTTSGTVNISGADIENINTANLRDMESYMTQDTQLFKDSIINNVRIGRLDATDEEVIAACKKASVHDFIMTLPNTYETQVGELGETLSGGERQRIGLARAFLHDAPFMLLDEPTSNLDSLNEAVILRSLKEESAGKTVVLVSHRASTMRIADESYSVENGRLC
jgi:ATP-binding cassette subfamily C protein